METADSVKSVGPCPCRREPALGFLGDLSKPAPCGAAVPVGLPVGAVWLEPGREEVPEGSTTNKQNP
jgi:hypothetical protein